MDRRATPVTIPVPAIKCARCHLMNAAETGLCLSCARPRITFTYSYRFPGEETETIRPPKE